MSRVLLFSGGADYTDPWHPFAETSAIVASILEKDGHKLTVVDTLDGLSEALGNADLLVVNAGGGPEPHSLDDRLASILAGYRGPLLALHVAATLLPEHKAWEDSLGGRWVRGVSMHPARGPLRLRSVSSSIFVGDLPAPLETVDEAYSWLRVSPEAEILLVHDYEGDTHPVIWTLDRGGRRTAYTALGHNSDAYEAPLAGKLLRLLVHWLCAGAVDSDFRYPDLPHAPKNERREIIDNDVRIANEGSDKFNGRSHWLDERTRASPSCFT